MPDRSALTLRATDLLRQMLGASAAFRDGQLEAILRTVHARARTLVVQRTGWGKSLVYFIATRLLREDGLGPALIISPLLSLMRNQIDAAARIGVRAVRIDSENPREWSGIERELRAGRIDALLISPERLASERFLRRALRWPCDGESDGEAEVSHHADIPVGLLVVDEAHCISDWGHDFRPDYRRIVRIASALPRGVAVLATTATANDRVAADVQEQLAPGLQILRGPLTRESLKLQSIRLHDRAGRLAWLAQHLPRLPGAGIVYCMTTRDCDRVSAWLREHGIEAPAYHAKIGTGRAQLEQRLLNNDVKALVATVALGMGFDKPDLGFVVHYQSPGSIVAYYQQIGRAGRALHEAYAILLNGREDDEIQDYFIESACPPAYEMQMVLDAVERAGPASLEDLETLAPLRRPRLRQCVKLLEVDEAIVRRGGQYARTAKAWTPDDARSQRVMAVRRGELAEMRAFGESRTCLMAFIARALDDRDARPCGRCGACRGDLISAGVDPRLARAAQEFLDRLSPERADRWGRRFDPAEPPVRERWTSRRWDRELTRRDERRQWEEDLIRRRGVERRPRRATDIGGDPE